MICVVECKNSREKEGNVALEKEFDVGEACVLVQTLTSFKLNRAFYCLTLAQPQLEWNYNETNVTGMKHLSKIKRVFHLLEG